MSKKSITLKIIAIVVAVVAIYYSLFLANSFFNNINKDIKYEQIDISQIITKPKITNEEYKTLYLQTGLAKSAVDDVLSKTDGETAMLEYQQMFLSTEDVVIDMLTPITAEELIKKDDDNTYRDIIASVEDGDILISASSNTLGVRHGHAGIVIDAEKGETLEAFTIGQPSGVRKLEKWNKFSTFIILRLKDVSEEERREIAKFAEDNMADLSYSILAGTQTKSKPLDQIKMTHCSHIVWYSYMNMGYDIDYDKGVIVTPKDIARSPLLEVVQVYGLDPIKLW